jgi:fibronectin type 3 domain-containing protein
MRSPTRAGQFRPARSQGVTLRRLLLVLGLVAAALGLGGPAGAVPPPGLVAAYSFDEGAGGVVTDASGNGHFGTIAGASWTTSGRFGGALSFNGTNASVDLGGLGTFYRTAFTLEAWVQKQTATKNDVTVLGTWTANETGGPMIWVDHLATHYQLTMNQGLSNYLDSGQNPVAGAWQHLAVTFDGTTARFYINGTEVANRTVSVSIGSSNSWRVGAYGSTPTGFFDGLIDEVRVYNRALSAVDVQADMNQPVSALTGPDTTPPSAPGTLGATGGSGQVSLTWGAATDNIAVTKYDVYRSTTAGFTPDASNRIAQPTGTSYTDSGLAVGTYYYRVAAEDAAGNVGPSSNEATAAASDGAAPTAPTGLSGAVVSTTVNLTWTASSDNVGVTRYNVHRGTSSGFTPTTANRIAQPTGTSYSDIGLAPGTYYYKVTAQDAAGNVSGASNESAATIPDSTAPSAPGSLTATLAGTTVSLGWTASTDDVGVVRYNVHRGTSSGFTPTSANRIAQPTGTTYSDSPPTAGTYYYKVTAEDAAGNLSPSSNEVVVTVFDATPPTAPSSLTATASGGSINLTWTAATDNVGVARYNLHRATSSGFTPTTANRIAQPTGTSYSDTNLVAGTYYYKVTAEDAAGNVGAASNEASATAANTDTTPPTVAITAPAGGATVSASVSVTADATDNQSVAGVQFKVDGQSIAAEDTVAPYSVNWDTQGQLNGPHTLTAVARDGGGNTTTSSPVTVTVSNNSVSLTGLRAAYSFDDGAGTAALDSSGNYNTASLLGAGWATGHFGGAVSLSGSSAEVDPPAFGTFYKTGFTYEAWVLKQTTKLDVGIVGSWVGNQGGGAMLWIDHLSGDYRLALGTNLGNYVDSHQTPTVGQWQYVAATYDGTNARIYVDGVLAASATFTANVGNSNTWRIGAYGSPAGGFFDGSIDNVRIYDRALTSAEIQTDMASRIQPDGTPPTVTTFTPAPGATGVNFGTSATAKFSEPMQPATITSSTFQLKDASNNVVPATVTYNASTYVATLNPQSALQFGATYTLTVKGGTGGAADLAGNPLATDATSSFTTEDRATPILIVTSSANPFSSYLAEILRNEGLDAFTTLDVSLLTPSSLSGFDVVLLGDTNLTPAQVSALTGWVNGGGNLIAMHPDKQLAGLLGLATASGNLTNAYLKIDTGAAPGAGIVGSTIQYHGTADRYTLNGAAAVATLYSNASTATSNPAATLRSVGSSGGQAAAFTYDLARSVVLTRQGNPAWAGQERDGVSGIRPDDMFYSNWLDTSRIAIPQADEQQRLLVNMITTMERDKLPLPRFWYLPRGKKAVIVMSGDDHSPTNAPGGTASIFDRFKQLSPPGCVVSNWECIRATSYVYPNSVLTNQQAAGYVADGFEVALHPVVGSCPTATMTQAQLSTYFDTQLGQFTANFTSVPAPVTSRTHCVYWPDWSSNAKVELAHGIRMDGNYYHYPSAWIGNKPGFMNGGGFPMRFADTDGTLIDVYQENTNMTDESGQAYPATVNTLLDNALGSLGYYGAFGTNIHTDNPAPNVNDEAIVASAQARGVPIISYKQLLDWVDGRNSSTIRSLSWTGGTLTFNTSVGAGANGLQTMLPMQGPAGTLTALTSSGSAVPYTVQTIKGIQYAMFDAGTATYQATYS